MEKRKKSPTRLKKMQLNSVDLVRRGANPDAHIALKKSFEEEPEKEEILKADEVLPSLTDVLGESLQSIAKDNSLSHEDMCEMINKSISEFKETVDGYLTSLGIVEKSLEDDSEDFIEEEVEKAAKAKKQRNNVKKSSKGVDEMFNFENVDKSLLSPDEVATLESLIAKAKGEEVEKEEEPTPGKVDPAKAKKQMEENGELHPEVKKALEKVEALEKSLEMQQYTNVAKKYEQATGEKAEEIAKTLYDLKKSGDANYNAYVALLDKQVEMTKGLFEEIGKSGNYNYTQVAKGEPEKQIETIAKSYMEKDPTMSYNMAIAKAWENNAHLFDAYEQGM